MFSGALCNEVNMFSKTLLATAAVIGLIGASSVDAATVKVETQYNTTVQQWQGKGSINDNFGPVNLELEGTATEDESKEPFINGVVVKAGVPFTVGTYFNILPRIEVGYGSTPRGTGIDSTFWGAEIKSEQPTFIVPKLDTVVGYRYRHAFNSDLDFHTSRIEAGLVYHLDSGNDIGASYYNTNWNTNTGADINTNAVGVNYTFKF